MRLFIYDHCPYCVRARIPFGIKKVPFELVDVLNDDEATPISMIGVKACPILEKEDGSFMGESMDIVEYVDQLDGKPIFLPSEQNAELASFYQNTRMALRYLLYPRWVNSPLAEFATESARNYFIGKKEQTIGSFDDALANTAQYKAELEAELLKLNDIIASEKSVNQAGLSYDDIDLFGRLRGITLIKDLSIPAKVRAYIDYFAKVSDIPTYDDIAQ